MMLPLKADLEIPAAHVLYAAERAYALQIPDAATVSELCARAAIRYRVSGGRAARIVLWDGPGHGTTVTDDYQTVFAIDRTKLPLRDPQRALRTLEILAYGC